MTAPRGEPTTSSEFLALDRPTKLSMLVNMLVAKETEKEAGAGEDGLAAVDSAQPAKKQDDKKKKKAPEPPPADASAAEREAAANAKAEEEAKEAAKKADEEARRLTEPDCCITFSEEGVAASMPAELKAMEDAGLPGRAPEP